MNSRAHFLACKVWRFPEHLKGRFLRRYRRFALYVLPLLFVLEIAVAQARGVRLVSKGRAVNMIVMSVRVAPADSEAAQVLQKYVRAISGATLPIRTGEPLPLLCAVWIGISGRCSAFPARVDRELLEQDAFTLRTEGRGLLIAGGTEKGSPYAVYTLLETCPDWHKGAGGLAWVFADEIAVE